MPCRAAGREFVKTVTQFGSPLARAVLIAGTGGFDHEVVASQFARLDNRAGNAAGQGWTASRGKQTPSP